VGIFGAACGSIAAVVGDGLAGLRPATAATPAAAAAAAAARAVFIVALRVSVTGPRLLGHVTVAFLGRREQVGSVLVPGGEGVVGFASRRGRRAVVAGSVFIPAAAAGLAIRGSPPVVRSRQAVVIAAAPAPATTPAAASPAAALAVVVPPFSFRPWLATVFALGGGGDRGRVEVADIAVVVVADRFDTGPPRWRFPVVHVVRGAGGCRGSRGRARRLGRTTAEAEFGGERIPVACGRCRPRLGFGPWLRSRSRCGRRAGRRGFGGGLRAERLGERSPGIVGVVFRHEAPSGAGTRGGRRAGGPGEGRIQQSCRTRQAGRISGRPGVTATP
jgi:hypothetical protein